VVSIVMCTYNRASKLVRAIESVVAQTYKDWELIIVDDASTDDTQNTIAAYKESNEIERLVYIKNNQNRGVSYSRNIGLSQVSGEYVAFLDSDDEWYYYHLEEAVDTLSSTGYQVCCGLWAEEHHGAQMNVWDIDWFKESALEMQQDLNVNIKDRLWLFGDDFYEYVLKTCFYCFQINTIVVRKNVIDDIGTFNEEQKTSEDMEYTYRILAKYNLVVINKPHFLYHFGEDNLYAYTEREKFSDNWKSAPIVEKERFIRNLIYKTKFFLGLDKSLQDLSIFKDPNAVTTSINYNIVVRCLTILLLSSESAQEERHRYYYELANEYARDKQLKHFVRNYTKDAEIQQYFCYD